MQPSILEIFPDSDIPFFSQRALEKWLEYLKGKGMARVRKAGGRGSDPALALALDLARGDRGGPRGPRARQS